MLRLTLSKNLQFLSKTLATNVDQMTNRFANQLKHTTNVTSHRPFSITAARFCEEKSEGDGEEVEDSDEKVSPLYKKYAGTPRDRTKIIPYETSAEYLKSPAYQSTYGDKRVWELFRRVHKGQFARLKTRQTCIRSNVIATGSPCPICRDEYLVLDYRNLELLKQFISPHTGEVCNRV